MYKVASFSGLCHVFGWTKKASDVELGWGMRTRLCIRQQPTLNIMQASITILSADVVGLVHMDISESSNYTE